MKITKEMLRRFYGWSVKPTIEECAEKAYKDLCRTLNFSIPVSKLNKKKKEEKEKYIVLKRTFREKVGRDINIRIVELLKEPEKPFEDWHKEMCEHIIGLAKGAFIELFNKDKKTGEEFHYGQAQKWVNMTFKNMIIAELPECEDLKKVERCLHVPMDMYTMEAAFDLQVPLPSKNGCMKKFKEFNIDKYLPWSKWDRAQYKKVQTELREAIKENYPGKSPLDWEFEAWIEKRDSNNNL